MNAPEIHIYAPVLFFSAETLRAAIRYLLRQGLNRARSLAKGQDVSRRERTGQQLMRAEPTAIIQVARFRASTYNSVMQHRKTISLTARDDGFIADQIDAGEYGNASEVVRAGLRLLEQEHLKLAALRKDIAKGDADVKHGRTKTYQPGQVGARLKKRIGKTKHR